MAALNFPLSPNDGDVYGNYVYDATEGVWNANPQQLASRFVTSATQPTSPSNGDGWLDTNTGKTYIYYNDGSSAQWIESGNPVIGFVDPYDQTTTSTGHFALPKGTSAQRPVAPENGDIRFNTDLGEPEYYSESEGAWFLFREQALGSFSVSYLVIAGGGGGGNNVGGGGGAGGYRCNVSGESSGGGASAESALNLVPGTYTVTVGAGGAGGVSVGTNGSPGASSVFSTVSTTGGGYGATAGVAGGNGGSGGGSGYTNTTTSTGTTGEGFDSTGNSNSQGSGGGGAGALGNGDGTGGSGVSSSITGSSVGRAGGGGGGHTASPAGPSSASDGGGAGGADNNAGTAGTVNAGAGGGGGGGGDRAGAAGGSGVVIFKVPSTVSASFSVGLTEENGGSGQTLGDYKVYTVTAGTGTVTFS